MSDSLDFKCIQNTPIQLKYKRMLTIYMTINNGSKSLLNNLKILVCLIL